MWHRRVRRQARPLWAGLVALAMLVGMATPAGAAWVGASGPATTHGRAISLPGGPTPTATATTTSVTVSWPPVLLSDGSAPQGYRVTRYAGATAQTVGAGCAGTITTTSCTETNLPDGTWTYRVQVAHQAWRGALGPASNEATTATPDTTPPAIGAIAVAKAAGGDPNAVRQGGTYFVYASVTDPGAPASGVNTVRANASSLTTGATALPLTAGSFAVNGVTYGYRSALQTANNPLSAGAKSITITATDHAGNQTTSGAHTVQADNTTPATVDVQTVNGGPTVGRAETNDRIVYTFNEPIDANSILPGWTGAATAVTVRLQRTGPDDEVEIFNGANTTATRLGLIDLAAKGYVNVNSPVHFTGSSMVRSGNTVVITLGTPNGTALTNTKTATMVWTPLAGITDFAGNALPTTPRTESGADDVEF